MVGKTHDIIGFATLVIGAAIFPPEQLNAYTFSACIIGNVVGSLLPDLDDAGNRLWDLLPAGNFVAKFARKIFFRHRTLTHSILGGFLLYKGLWWLLPRILNPSYVDVHLVFISIAIGYVAHLLADMLTKDGIPLLFPFKWYFGIPPLSFLRIRTGGFIETFIVFPGVIIATAVFIFMNYPSYIQLIELIRS